ncbi:MAG: thioredoxin family protein [Myxococcales bacterium]|nr:thioredoxin family protein [Myxococcales bacterium]
MKEYIFLLFISTFILNANQIKEINKNYSLEILKEDIKNSRLPVILYFTADWCMSCKEMERTTFLNKYVKKELNKFKFILIDVTLNNKDDKEIMEYYNISGLVTIIFNSTKLEKKVRYQNSKDFLSSLNMINKNIDFFDNIKNIEKEEKRKELKKLTDEKNIFNKKIERLKVLSSQNNKNAQFLLGIIYLKDNLKESILLMKKAELNFCPAATGFFGLKLFDKHKYKKGFDKVLYAAINGDIFSQAFISTLYKNGKYIKKDYVESYSWLFQVFKYNKLVYNEMIILEKVMSKLDILKAKNIAKRRIEKLGEIPFEVCYGFMKSKVSISNETKR